MYRPERNQRQAAGTGIGQPGSGTGLEGFKVDARGVVLDRYTKGYIYKNLYSIINIV